MTQHNLGPGWIQLNYTSNGHSHKQLLPVVYDGVPDAGSDPQILQRNGTAVAASTAMAAYAAKLKVFFDSAATLDSWYAYYQANPESNILFIYSDVLAVAGTNAAAANPANEAVFTFKTTQPGGLKIYLMESAFGDDQRTPQPAGTGSDQRNFTDFMVGSTGFITGRNGDFPLIPLFLTTKQNDHFRRKYLL